MAAIMTLQTLCDYSDREAAGAARFDVRWKVACGLAIDEGFHPSSLVYWRKRLPKSDRPHRINDAVKKVVEETGILKGRRRQAVDSTILADAVLHANYRISGRQGKQGKAPATQTRRMESVSVCSRRDLPHPDGIPHS
jgi:hypothetical protein